MCDIDSETKHTNKVTEKVCCVISQTIIKYNTAADYSFAKILRPLHGRLFQSVPAKYVHMFISFLSLSLPEGQKSKPQSTTITNAIYFLIQCPTVCVLYQNITKQYI